ncbi:MAG: TolB family protein, partial [Candidatus Entotheonellia bacterium]
MILRLLTGLLLVAGLAIFTAESAAFAAARLPCTLAFHSNREGGYGIYLIQENGTGLRKLTDGPMDNNPAFAPDGRTLTFDRGEDIHLIQVDGTGLQNLTRHKAANACSWWSGQGEQVAFQTNRDGHFEVYVIRPDGTGVARLTRDTANNACPAFAGDGRRIAFVSDRHGTMDIFTMGIDDT